MSPVIPEYFLSTGTKEERGITAWQNKIVVINEEDTRTDQDNIYENILPAIIKRNRFLTKLPFFPKQKQLDKMSDKTDHIA